MDRVGMDINNLSEQEVTRCDSCDYQYNCWQNDKRITDPGWCLIENCEE